MFGIVIYAVPGHFLIASAQLGELVPHVRKVKAGVLLFLQRGQLCLQLPEFLGGIGERVGIAVLLLCGQVLLPVQVDDVFLQPADVFTAFL